MKMILFPATSPTAALPVDEPLPRPTLGDRPFRGPAAGARERLDASQFAEAGLMLLLTFIGLASVFWCLVAAW